MLGKVAGIPGLIEDKDSKNTHTSAMGIATSGIGTIGAGVSFFNNRYKKNKLLNANRRKAASQRQFASGLDFFGGLFGVASNGGNIGLFGKNNLANKDGGIPQMVGGGLDILSGALGSMANIFKYKANRSDRKAHSDIVSKADEIRGADYARDTADLDQSRQELKNIYAQNGSAPLAQSQALTDARTKRHTAKAKLYAMEQAARMHQVKYDNSSNGGAGLLFGSLGSVGTVLKGFGKMMGSGNGLLAQIGYYTGALGTLAKGINLAHGAYKNSDKGKDKAKKAVEDEKRSIVDSYLNDAAQRIIDDAQQWHPTQAESDNLANTDNDDISDDANIMPVEARRLALMRLGIQVANNADVRNNAHYDEAFKKITEKRANNIINSSANERHSMLEALGLDDDASFDQIYTVLSGETF